MAEATSIENIHRCYKEKVFNVYDLTLSMIHKTIKVGWPNNHLTEINFDDALLQAKALDKRLEKGDMKGRLFGIPMSVKD